MPCLIDNLEAANLQIDELKEALEKIISMGEVTADEKNNYWSNRAEHMRDIAMIAVKTRNK